MTRRRAAVTALAMMLATALPLTGCSGADTAPAGGTVRDAVFFGDSLTDAGTSGVRFTTMPGLLWSQLLAEQLGISTEPAVHGGPNYAEGGARVTSGRDGGPAPVSAQVDHYLADHASFAADQLVTLFIGTNDVLAGNTADAADAASAEVDQVGRLLDAGARQVLVLTLFDLAYTPAFGGDTTAQQEDVRARVLAYNDRLQRGLADRFPGDPRVGVFDTHAFLDGLVGAPAAHGFAHGGSEDACAVPGASSCSADQMVSAHADESYIFAGGLHLTTHTNELLAAAVQARVGELWGNGSD